MKGARVQSDPKASKLNESLLAYRSRSKEVINRIKQIYLTQKYHYTNPLHHQDKSSPLHHQDKSNPLHHQDKRKSKNQLSHQKIDQRLNKLKTQQSSNPNLRIKIPIKSRTPNTKSPIAFTKRSQNKHESPPPEPLTERPPRLEELKRKANDLKISLKLNGTQKFFRREKQKPIVPQKNSLNQTLKMVWQKKAKKANKTQFKMVRSLGKSQAGDIIQAVSNNIGLVAAIKTFRKNELKLQFLIDQMKIHLYCQHPNILPAYGYNFGREEVYLVMEVGQCNLYDKIVRYAPYQESTVAYFISQVAAGIAYLHQSGIMHRDIKPENIICFGDCLKIADFGWSIQAARPRKTLCGTLDYLSPQVSRREYYNNKIDCWSIGVLMYELLTGQPPFPEQKETSTDFKNFTIPHKLSQSGKDLLLNLLRVDPVLRLPAKTILQHDWIIKFVKKYKNERKNKFKQLHQQVSQLFN